MTRVQAVPNLDCTVVPPSEETCFYVREILGGDTLPLGRVCSSVDKEQVTQVFDQNCVLAA